MNRVLPTEQNFGVVKSAGFSIDAGPILQQTLGDAGTIRASDIERGNKNGCGRLSTCRE
jgi:hypothetical protein